jgi:ferritin-like metal-binding protein YciE
MEHSNKIDLGPQHLKEYFFIHLNKIYCAKQHLLERLPRLATLAGFKGLKDAIENSSSEIARQIGRMDEIYKELNEVHQPDSCKGFKSLIEEVFVDIDLHQGSQSLQDMSIIYYLQNIESLQMASLQALQLAAVRFGNEPVNALLQKNFSEAKAERELLVMLSAKYLTS